MSAHEKASDFVKKFVGVPTRNTAYYVVDYNEETHSFGVIDVNSSDIYDVISDDNSEINTWEVINDSSTIKQFITQALEQHNRLIERTEKQLTDMRVVGSLLSQFLQKAEEVN